MIDREPDRRDCLTFLMGLYTVRRQKKTEFYRFFSKKTFKYIDSKVYIQILRLSKSKHIYLEKSYS